MADVTTDGIVWVVQEALRQADTYGDGTLYAASPGQLPDHVHNRVARVVDEVVAPIVRDLTVRAGRAEYERDDARRTHDRREDRIGIMRREVTRLRAALGEIASEDWRGPQPRAIGIAKAALAGD